MRDMEDKDKRVFHAKEALKAARRDIQHAIRVLEMSHETVDKIGPLFTIEKRIDLWITRENNHEEQPSR
jgi:hypothetical protein